MDNAAFAFVGIILLLVFAYLWNRREMKKDQEEHEAWWTSYQEHSRRALVDMATRHEFPRDPDETDEEYSSRFKEWIYAHLGSRS